MNLTLSIRTTGSPAGSPASTFVTEKRGITIGRAQECDLVLPDPRSLISRRHCHIDWDGNGYVLTDTSTGGTPVNDHRPNGPCRLNEGDVIAIGGYQLIVGLSPGPRINLDSWNTGPSRSPSPPVAAASQSPTLIQGAGATPAGPGGLADPVTQLLAAAGLSRGAVPVADGVVLAASGALLRQFFSGLAAMATARARARTELGVDATSTDRINRGSSDFASPAVMADLLRAGPAVAVPRVAAALGEVDVHQRAILYAMQGALAKTLESIAPAAIRKQTKGNEAALWRAYESAFAGVADEAGFIEIFARELGVAYQKLAATPTGP